MQSFRTTFNSKQLDLSWSNIDNLKTFSAHQLGRYYFTPEMSNEDFFKLFNTKVSLNFQRIVNNIDVNGFEKIVDVGCGIAVPDCLISKLNTTCKFYLVDKSEISHTGSGKYYEPKHGHYNSWDVLEDCIQTSGLNRSNFNLLSPTTPWPDDVDLVLSTYSWCWHYPKETYWGKVQASLKIGGTLAIDIYNLPDKDTAGEITEEFKSEPMYIPTKLPDSVFANQFTLKDGAMGGFYIWRRNA
jgi:SAM-dependent methyltransferase